MQSDSNEPVWLQVTDEYLHEYWETGQLPDDLTEEMIDKMIRLCKRAKKNERRHKRH